MLATVRIQAEVEKGNLKGGGESENWRGEHSWRDEGKEKGCGKFLCA